MSKRSPGRSRGSAYRRKGTKGRLARTAKNSMWWKSRRSSKVTNTRRAKTPSSNRMTSSASYTWQGHRWRSSSSPPRRAISLAYVKPYFVVPKKGPQSTAFAVGRQAMIDAGMVAWAKSPSQAGETPGRVSTSPDASKLAWMLYILRFAEDVRDPGILRQDPVYETGCRSQLQLAGQLIKTI